MSTSNWWAVWMVESRLLSGFSFSVSSCDGSVLGHWSSSVLTVWVSISISSEPVLKQGPNFTYITPEWRLSVQSHVSISQSLRPPSTLTCQLPVFFLSETVIANSHFLNSLLSPPCCVLERESRGNCSTLTSLVGLCDPLNCVHAEHW